MNFCIKVWRPSNKQDMAKISVSGVVVLINGLQWFKWPMNNNLFTYKLHLLTVIKHKKLVPNKLAVNLVMTDNLKQVKLQFLRL